MSTPPNALIFPRSSAVFGQDERAGEVAHFGIPLKEIGRASCRERV